MARPKGIKQKRNESKYLLPQGVSLKPNQSNDFNKDTILVFIDHEFGEFQSTYKRIQSSGFSVHPDAVKARRNQTNLIKYGSVNPGANKEVINKRKSTMKSLYGVENALENKDIYNKMLQDNINKFGTDNPLKLQEFQDKAKQTLKNTYGVENAMHNEEIKNRLIKTSLSKYGTRNPAQSSVAKESYLKTMEDNLFESEGQKEVLSYVKSLGLEAKGSYIGGTNPKSLDIKIKELNIAIEYNGAYWHSEANKQIYPSYHLDKYRACKDNGIKLIQLFDFEWNEKQRQVKSFLKSALGKNEIKHFARNCELKEVPKQEAKEFLETYHILGSGKIHKSFGLYIDDELLQLITIGKHHRNSQEFVLNRFCGKENVSVVGGLSKLCHRAKMEFGSFSTWIDLRFSNGESWLKSGWKLEKQLPIDYFYYNTKNGKVISKQSRQKRLVNTPEGMTEREHSLMDGLARIYDCGKLKLTF